MFDDVSNNEVILVSLLSIEINSEINAYRKAPMMLGRLFVSGVKVRRLCDVLSVVNGWLPLEKVFREDWYRVLITSNGHVNTAPKVPASLETVRSEMKETDGSRVSLPSGQQMNVGSTIGVVLMLLMLLLIGTLGIGVIGIVCRHDTRWVKNMENKRSNRTITMTEVCDCRRSLRG